MMALNGEVTDGRGGDSWECDELLTMRRYWSGTWGWRCRLTLWRGCALAGVSLACPSSQRRGPPSETDIDPGEEGSVTGADGIRTDHILVEGHTSNGTRNHPRQL